MSHFARVFRSRALSRSVFLVVDQGLNSITNILVTVLVAREASLEQFGVFATVQLGVAFGQTVAMASLGDRWLQGDPSDQASRFAAGMAIYRRTGVVAVTVAALLALITGPNAILIGAVAVPAIAGLDYMRIVLYATGHSGKALAMDAAYGLLQLTGLLIWVRTKEWSGSGGAWLAWASAAYLVFAAFATGLVRAQPVVHRAKRPPIRSVASVRYGGEMIVLNGGSLVAQLVVSARLGVAFNGIFRATLIPFGPLSLLLQASRAVLIPALRAGSSRETKRLIIAVVCAYAVLCGACTGFAYAVAELPALRPIIGGIHPQAEFVLLTGLLFLFTGIYVLTFYYFRAQQADLRVTFSRLVLIGALLASMVVALLVGTSTAFLLGSSLSWAAGTVGLLAGRVGLPWQRS